MVVFNLAIFATFDNDGYSVQVPKTPQTPRKPKIKSYFTTLSLDCFIRLMIQVFLFHIDLTLTVAIFTENCRQNRLK